jgi:hypothetical protein
MARKTREPDLVAIQKICRMLDDMETHAADRVLAFVFERFKQRIRAEQPKAEEAAKETA